ncbi:hypothetical protein [Oleiharenicola sp. Vm1]|uniref:hypothetical protein n=1 Tax=Oleiharenicola sp. Vm1 TaxID=3398393 RepID=UPI0039F5E681
MNPETIPVTNPPAPVAAQPAPVPAVVSVAPTASAPSVAPQPVVTAAVKPAAPRPGKKQRASKHAPAL